MEASAESDDQHICTMEARLVALANSTCKLLVKMSDLESWSRRNNILVIGLPESIEGPTPIIFFSKLLVELFREETSESLPELDSAHRALNTKPPPGSRPVIIRLHHYWNKDLIIREARRRRGKLQYGGIKLEPPSRSSKTMLRRWLKSVLNIRL